MKSKTNVLFVTLSVVLIALCVITVNLYKSQNEMKQALANAEKQTDLNSDNSAPIVKANYMSYDEEDIHLTKDEKIDVLAVLVYQLYKGFGIVGNLPKNIEM